MKVASAKVIIKKLYHMNQSSVECISLLQNAFVFNSLEFLDECEAKAKKMLQTVKALTEEFIDDAKVDPDARVYVSVSDHIEKMVNFIEDIVGCIRTKIRDGISFSEKAVLETTFLLARLQDVLRNLNNIILSRDVILRDHVKDRHLQWSFDQVPLSKNVILREYVKKSTSEINRSADEFVTMHEGRLSEGLCMPIASPLFLHMLDAIKGIAGHAKETAEKLTAA
jgi:Na+/phosphate symporter